MTNDYEPTLTGAYRALAAEPLPALAMPGPDYQRMRGSVSELERLASELRFAGEHHATESLELRIISLLEQKITRKLLAKRRQGRKSGTDFNF